jgi:hypothetical protein
MWSVAFKEKRELGMNSYKKIFGCKKNKGNDKYIFQRGDCNESYR